MYKPTAHSLLATWEWGLRRHPLDRGLLLYSLAVPEAEPDALADRTVGQRNATLLRLHQALFGDGLRACLDCPMCGETLEFSVSASELLTPSGESPASVEVDGLRFRLPTTRDLARIAGAVDATGAAQGLLLSLVEGDSAADERVAVSLASKVAAALDEADPCLDFVLNLQCPPCGHAWTSSLDVVSFLWEEVEAYSRRLLDEVHVLARAYGWAERDILGLTEARRAAYLERALA